MAKKQIVVGATIHELMQAAIRTVQKMSPEEKAALRKRLDASLLKKKPSKTRDNLWVN